MDIAVEHTHFRRIQRAIDTAAVKRTIWSINKHGPATWLLPECRASATTESTASASSSTTICASFCVQARLCAGLVSVRAHVCWQRTSAQDNIAYTVARLLKITTNTKRTLHAVHSPVLRSHVCHYACHRPKHLPRHAIRNFCGHESGRLLLLVFALRNHECTA